MERLYTTSEAGEVLRITAAGVLQLIHDGKLRARTQLVRPRDKGRTPKPRKFILASELERYVRELPDANKPAERQKVRRAPAGLRQELAAATQYY